MDDINLKQHAACDECRRRKIKCSGQPRGCQRCQQEHLRCVYSNQKPMGRPKKRRRNDDPPTTEEFFTDPDLIDTLTSSFDPYQSSFDFQNDLMAPELSTTQLQTSMMPELDSLEFGLPSSDQVQLLAPADSTAVAPGNTTNHTQVGPFAFPTPGSDGGTTQPATCSCMSNMYQATSNMPNEEQFTFPASLGRMRFSLRKAEEILTCAKCTQNPSQRRQNTMFLIPISSSLACAFDKLLRDVDSEAERLAAIGEKKVFQMGDPSFPHLHTGGPDCPMKIDVNLDPQDWRKLAFQAIKSQVSDTDESRLTLDSLLTRLEQRQKAWHAYARGQIPHSSGEAGIDRPDSTCVQMIKNVRQIVEDMPA